MGKVRLLDKHTAELIAAGEVVERPASVIKELMENSIDAGARAVTVEIKSGGITYMRITDDGEGIAHEDVPTAFLRHATSKITTGDDLDAIRTLGFRGEALASIAAIARVELITRTESEEIGTHFVIEGGEDEVYDECGCAQGTTIIVRDIFYNTPARMKFLKKDFAEGNAIASLVDRIALSHPEVSVRLVRDGKETLMTSGDASLKSAIYAVFGREFACGMIPVEYSLNGVNVSGFISKPANSRPNRSMQVFYINGRYCRSRTMQTAIEEACKGMVMVGKHPACVLNVEIDCSAVDVNVHPAKLEVRFTNERPIFEGVYYATKNAIGSGDARKPIILDSKSTPLQGQLSGGLTVQQRNEQMSLPLGRSGIGDALSGATVPFGVVTAAARRERMAQQTPSTSGGDSQGGTVSVGNTPLRCEPPVDAGDVSDHMSHAAVSQQLENGKLLAVKDNNFTDFSPINSPVDKLSQLTSPTEHSSLPTSSSSQACGIDLTSAEPTKISAASDFALPSESFIDDAEKDDKNSILNAYTSFASEQTINDTDLADSRDFTAANDNFALPDYKIIGEAFETYIIVQSGDELILIDKHAAHERLIYERLVSSGEGHAPQLLLTPISITLDKVQYSEMLDAAELLMEAGFEIEDFGPGTLLIRSVPAVLADSDIEGAVLEIAGNLEKGRNAVFTSRMEDIFHTIACRSAIKAHDRSLTVELAALVVELISNPEVRYCPHGRPIYTSLTRREIEKGFGRIK